jgi:hypothetical protein
MRFRVQSGKEPFISQFGSRTNFIIVYANDLEDCLVKVRLAHPGRTVANVWTEKPKFPGMTGFAETTVWDKHELVFAGFEEEG